MQGPPLTRAARRPASSALGPGVILRVAVLGVCAGGVVVVVVAAAAVAAARARRQVSHADQRRALRNFQQATGPGRGPRWLMRAGVGWGRTRVDERWARGR